MGYIAFNTLPKQAVEGMPIEDVKKLAIDLLAKLPFNPLNGVLRKGEDLTQASPERCGARGSNSIAPSFPRKRQYRIHFRAFLFARTQAGIRVKTA